MDSGGGSQQHTTETSQAANLQSIGLTEEHRNCRSLPQPTVAPIYPGHTFGGQTIHEEPEGLDDGQVHHRDLMRLGEEAWKSQNLLTFGI